jgi:hypothetical protein
VVVCKGRSGFILRGGGRSAMRGRTTDKTPEGSVAVRGCGGCSESRDDRLVSVSIGVGRRGVGVVILELAIEFNSEGTCTLGAFFLLRLEMCCWR